MENKTKSVDLDSIEARAKQATPIYRGFHLFEDACGDEFPDAHGAWVTRDYARRLSASANDVPALIAALREARTITPKQLEAAAKALYESQTSPGWWNKAPNDWKINTRAQMRWVFKALGYTLPSEENS